MFILIKKREIWWIWYITSEQALTIPASLRTDQLSLDNRFKVADDNEESDETSDDEDDKPAQKR